MGHGDYGIIDSESEVVSAPLDKELAEHMVELHNQSLKTKNNEIPR